MKPSKTKQDKKKRSVPSAVDHPFCRCLFYSANALARGVTRIAEEAFAPTGLSPSHAYVLLTVLKDPGISPSDVAVVMMLDASTVTRLIERLVQKDLVMKKSKGRSVEVYPTKDGKALEPKVLSCAKTSFQRFRDVVGPELADLTERVFRAAVTIEESRSSHLTNRHR